MNLIIFIVLALVLLALSIAFILKTLLKVDLTKNLKLEKQRQADNLEHFEKQLHELQNKLENKEISQDEFDQYKFEAERRALKDSEVIDSSSKTSTQSPIALIITICTALPIGAILLYLSLGSPLALDASKISEEQIVRNEPRTLEQAKSELLAELKRDPENVEAKFALGKLYYANQQFKEARDTLKDLFNQQPDRPDVLVAYAEAQARMQNNLFKGAPFELIKRALQLEPQNKKANWLLGISAFQENNTKGALTIWQNQLKRTDNTPHEKQMLENMIAQAGGTIEKPKLNDDQAHLTVTTSISPDLQGQFKSSDSVFIYAKAASGPSMPLAIHRTTADKLPLTLTLTDADAMTPQMKLSMFKDIIVIARISKTGNAITQSGDLQGQSPVLNNNNQNISVEIGSIIP